MSPGGSSSAASSASSSVSRFKVFFDAFRHRANSDSLPHHRSQLHGRSAAFLCTANTINRVPTPPGKSRIFLLENSRTWKVPENHFGLGKSWKLKLMVLESHGKISSKVVHFSSGSNDHM